VTTEGPVKGEPKPSAEPAVDLPDASVAPSVDAVAALPPDPSDDREIAETLQRMESKPPLYRFFRGAMYGIYLVVAAWIVLAIAVSSWRSVYGKDGQALKQRAVDNAPVSATTLGEPIPPQQRAPGAKASPTE